MTKAVVILSGGQDSLTCLYWALQQEEFDLIKAITFNYGQNHAIEVELSKKVCVEEGVSQAIVDLSFLNEIVDSEMLTGGDTGQIKNGLPTSFVPNRNALFITLAHAYAQKLGAQFLIGGMCETDYSGYPDCRSNFIQNFVGTLNTGSNQSITIITPLMFITKAQTFQMAENLGRLEDVLIKSHTCYKADRTPNEWGAGCGKCPACVLRAKGYEEFLKQKNKYSLVK